MDSNLQLILPLDTTFGSKRKAKKSDVTFSLNNFLAPLGKAVSRQMSFYHQKNAKIFLQDIVRDQLKNLSVIGTTNKKKAILRIYPPNNRRRDIDNFSILFKFALDVIKEKHLPDDDTRYIVACETLLCPVDKENPRAELEIRDVSPVDFQDWTPAYTI